MAKGQKLDSKEKRAKDFIDISLRKGATNEEASQWVRNSKRLLDWYKGKFYHEAERRKRFTRNTLYALRNTLLPHFIIQTPHFRVKPQNARYHREVLTGELKGETAYLEPGVEQVNMVKQARNMEAVMNHHYQKSRLIFENRKAINDHFFYPFGVTKSGLDFDQLEDGTIAKDEIYLKRVAPTHFGYHPMATSAEDSPLLCEEMTKLKSKLSKKFKNVDKAQIELSSVDKKKFEKMNASDLMSDYINIFEVHDQDSGLLYTFAGSNKILIDKKEIDVPFNGSAYNILKFAGDEDEFLGIPMFSMIEDHVVALNDIMTLMVEHFKKFPGQVFIEKGAADEDDIRRIQTGEQGSIHMVNNVQKILRTAPLNMGNEYFGIATTILNDIFQVLGVFDFSKTGGSSRKSASESSFIQGDINTRKGYFLQEVKDFVLRDLEKQAAMKQEFMDQKEVIKATGDLNFEEFVVGKEEIKGDFFYDFDVDNMAATDQGQLNNIINMLQVMAGNEVLHPSLQQLHPRKLSKALWSKAGLNLESFEKGEEETVIHMMPEQEEAMALDPKEAMPAPKRGEDYAAHLKSHEKFITDRIQEMGPEAAAQDVVVGEVINHIAITRQLQEMEDGSNDVQKKPGQNPQQQGAPTQQTQTTPELNQPVGPNQQVPQ